MTNYFSHRAKTARFALAMALLLTACTLPQFGQQNIPATAPDGDLKATISSVVIDSSSALSAAPSAPTSTPTPQASALPGGVVEISASDFSDPDIPAGGLILFTSTSAQPFTRLDVGGVAGKSSERYLWALSTDNRRAGRISPDGMGSALFLPGVPGQPGKLVQYGFSLKNSRIETINPPDECKDSAQPCGGFQFSPDGSALAYFTGEDSCGRTLKLYSLTRHKTISTWNNAHWAYFFNDGSLIISLGDCQTQRAYLYLPGSGQQAGVEQVGTPYWNPTHTAVVFQVQGKPELQVGLWGFNIETSKIFLWLSKDRVIEDTPIWLNDGQYFVFQHQQYLYDRATKEFILQGPRQIVLMNAWTRSQQLLGFDARSGYHLCAAADQAPGEPCAQPYGDWLRVQRQPYSQQRFSANQRDTPGVRCAMYGLDCKDAPEELAVNIETGKQYPWLEARVAQVTVTPAYHKPDMENEPLYQDPNLAYAFYVGKDGHTLWYVPRDREPTLWVQDGEGFIYLP
jgi:hypothetical protein